MQGRRKAREVALQVLYSLNFVNLDVEKALELFWGNFVAPKSAKEFAATLVEGTWQSSGRAGRADRRLFGQLVAWPYVQGRYQYFADGRV